MEPAANVPAPIANLNRYIAVSLSSTWANEPAFTEWLAQHLVELARRHDVSLVFVPCAARHDADCAVHESVAVRVRALEGETRLVEIREQHDPRTVAAVFSRALLTVGMRLHACVMAYANRTPFLGLAYHPKVMGFARTVGLERSVMPESTPRRQSEGKYGFSFADTGLAELDLAQRASEALDRACFDRLDELRTSLATAFLGLLGDARSGETIRPLEVTA
jgi:hypothetical protein